MAGYEGVCLKSLGRPRQADCHKFEAYLGYIRSCVKKGQKKMADNWETVAILGRKVLKCSLDGLLA